MRMSLHREKKWSMACLELNTMAVWLRMSTFWVYLIMAKMNMVHRYYQVYQKLL